jgi:hypothetical protein
MAVEDENISVRQWIAGHGTGLDYRELILQSEVSKAATGTRYMYRFPDRNLEERLRKDPDPFVRARLRENPDVYGSFFLSGMERHLIEATHLERLALMRNPEMGLPNPLIERILDLEDQHLSITPQQRTDLVMAYLTNPRAIQESHRSTFVDGFGDYQWRKHFSKLWKLVSAWPNDNKIRELFYRYIGIPDEALAADIIHRADKDKDTLWALAENESLSASLLRSIKARLIYLGEDKGTVESLARPQKSTYEGPNGAAYREINMVRSETNGWLIFLICLAIAQIIGRWLSISWLKSDAGDKYIVWGGLALVAVSRIVERYAKAILRGVDSCKQS